MTPSEAEAIVRKVWSWVHKCDGSYRHYNRGTILIQQVINQFLDFPDAIAALAFTREHMRKIAEKVEERNWIEGLIEVATGEALDGDFPIDDSIQQRILADINSALASLRRGVRAEYQDGRLEGL